MIFVLLTDTLIKRMMPQYNILSEARLSNAMDYSLKMAHIYHIFYSIHLVSFSSTGRPKGLAGGRPESEMANKNLCEGKWRSIESRDHPAVFNP
jgi:hypothetical protein